MKWNHTMVLNCNFMGYTPISYTPMLYNLAYSYVWDHHFNHKIKNIQIQHLTTEHGFKKSRWALPHHTLPHKPISSTNSILAIFLRTILVVTDYIPSYHHQMVGNIIPTWYPNVSLPIAIVNYILILSHINGYTPA